MTHKHLNIGGFGFPKKGFQILKCFGFPEWLPELEVVEASVQDGCDQGDGEDGVEQVDLLHNGQVRETVALFIIFSFEEKCIESPPKQGQAT